MGALADQYTAAIDRVVGQAMVESGNDMERVSIVTDLNTLDVQRGWVELDGKRFGPVVSIRHDVEKMTVGVVVEYPDGGA